MIGGPTYHALGFTPRVVIWVSGEVSLSIEVYVLWLIAVVLQEIVDALKLPISWSALVHWCVASVIRTSVVLCLIVVVRSTIIASIVIVAEPTGWVVVSGLGCLILGRRLPV